LLAISEHAGDLGGVARDVTVCDDESVGADDCAGAEDSPSQEFSGAELFFDGFYEDESGEDLFLGALNGASQVGRLLLILFAESEKTVRRGGEKEKDDGREGKGTDGFHGMRPPVGCAVLILYQRGGAGARGCAAMV